MSEHGRQDAIAAAGRLTDAVEGLSARLEEVKRGSEQRDQVLDEYGKRNRQLIRRAITSVVLDVVMTIAVTVAIAVSLHASGQASQAKSTSAAVHASNLAACAANNQTRADQVQFWDHVLLLVQTPRGLSPQQRQQQSKNLQAFRAYVRQFYAPRNCAALYHLR